MVKPAFMTNENKALNNRASNNRNHRVAIAQDTLAVIAHGRYRNARGEQVVIADDLARAVNGTVHYTGAELQALRDRFALGGAIATRIAVTNESSLSAARRLVTEGAGDVLCLNFASARNPGGGFLGGAEAQEENLAKSSGLYACLIEKMEMYEKNRAYSFCAYLDDMIYSPGVPVFRDDAYGYLDSAVPVTFVTAPAVNRGAVAKNTPDRLDELKTIMPRRIERLLALAQHRGHRALVLGAWGCGVFGNHPAQMAGWFRDALTGPFKGAFDRVHFAVLDRRNDGTYTAFAEAFAVGGAA